jgi:hypothetical protein
MRHQNQWPIHGGSGDIKADIFHHSSRAEKYPNLWILMVVTGYTLAHETNQVQVLIYSS